MTPSFAPAVRKPAEVLAIREVRKCIPSFSSQELEQHLQKFPAAEVKYIGWYLEPQYYIALNGNEGFFELSKNGYAPVDNSNRTYARHEAIHLIDCLNKNVLCRRFIDSVGVLLVANLSVPAWGAFHSVSERGCVRFFKFVGDVDFIQLDGYWTRTIVPFSFQFACGVEPVPFSKTSVVRITIDHNAQTHEWRVRGELFRKVFNEKDDQEPDRDPEGVMTEDERNEWKVSLPQIPLSRVAEMYAASKIANCKNFLHVQELEQELYERRAVQPAEQMNQS